MFHFYIVSTWVLGLSKYKSMKDLIVSFLFVLFVYLSADKKPTSSIRTYVHNILLWMSCVSHCNINNVLTVVAVFFGADLQFRRSVT